MSGMLVDNYRALLTSRGTNPEYPLDLLDSLQKEFQKGLDQGFVATWYIREKLETLTRFVDALEGLHNAAQREG